MLMRMSRLIRYLEAKMKTSKKKARLKQKTSNRNSTKKGRQRIGKITRLFLTSN